MIKLEKILCKCGHPMIGHSIGYGFDESDDRDAQLDCAQCGWRKDNCCTAYSQGMEFKEFLQIIYDACKESSQTLGGVWNKEKPLKLEHIMLNEEELNVDATNLQGSRYTSVGIGEAYYIYDKNAKQIPGAQKFKDKAAIQLKLDQMNGKNNNMAL